MELGELGLLMFDIAAMAAMAILGFIFIVELWQEYGVKLIWVVLGVFAVLLVSGHSSPESRCVTDQCIQDAEERSAEQRGSWR